MSWLHRISSAQRWMLAGLILIGGIGLFRPFLAGPGPVLYREAGEWRWFASGEIAESDSVQVMINPLWQVDARAIALEHRNLPPLSSKPAMDGRFLLGSDHLGRDVLAGLLYGTGTTLAIGFGSAAIALLLGLLLGISSGWYENDGWRISRTASVLMVVMFAFWTTTTLWVLPHLDESGRWPAIGWWLGLTGVLAAGAVWLWKRECALPQGSKPWAIPFDRLISRGIEILNTIPALILIMVLTSFLWEQTPLRLMLVIGLLRWPAIARYTRAEIIRLKTQPWMVHASHRYQSKWRLWLWELMPHLIAPLAGYVVYSIAAAVSMEAALSFLGLGLPPDQPSWGSMISASMTNRYAWWLYAFPGLLLLVLLIFLNRLGDRLLESRGSQGRRLKWDD
jgi:peptide/nickel transport system permease protein